MVNNAILLLNKTQNITSFQALKKVKWLFNTKKAGHGGTLDPLAEGLLPIFLGEAAKFSQFSLAADKSYKAVAQLGATSDTGDAEGTITFQTKAIPLLTASLLAPIQSKFTGQITQTPPMYSALKHQGKPLYDWARKGYHIERAARIIHIHQLTLSTTNNSNDKLFIDVTCSKGTYIRTLIEDIGQALGCGAYLVGLQRTAVPPFHLNQALTLKELEIMTEAERFKALCPITSLLTHLPIISLSDIQTQKVLHGQSIHLTNLKNNQTYQLLYGSTFVGIGETDTNNEILKPKRMLSQHNFNLF